MTEPRDEPGGSSIPLAIKLVIAAGLLYAVFAVVPLARVLDSIAAADLGFLVPGLTIPLISIWLSAARIRYLLDDPGRRLPISRIAQVNLVVSFYGLALPGALAGGVVRWHRLTRIGTGKGAALAAIAYARLVHVVGLVVLGLLFLAIEGPGGQAGRIGPSLGLGAILLGLIAIGYLGFHAERSRFSEALRLRGPGFVARWLERWHSVARGVRRLSRRDTAALWGLSALEHLVGILSLWLLARALSIDASFVTLGWIRSALAIATSLPITVSGLGIREGGLILMLEPYGVEGAAAVALSFLMLARRVVMGAIGGLLEARGAFRQRSANAGSRLAAGSEPGDPTGR